MVESGIKFPPLVGGYQTGTMPQDWCYISINWLAEGKGLLAAQNFNYAYLGMTWASVYTRRTLGQKINLSPLALVRIV